MGHDLAGAQGHADEVKGRSHISARLLQKSVQSAAIGVDGGDTCVMATRRHVLGPDEEVQQGA